MLPLDDERWKDLAHRGWSNGKRYELDLDAPFIPDVLRKLTDDPHDLGTFIDMAPYLCSEGTIWPAAFAAVPYIVGLASQVSPKERAEYLIWVGFMVTESEFVDVFLRDDYGKALIEALPLLLETFTERFDTEKTRYLLGALASLKGLTELGEIISDLDVYSFCHECDNENFDYEKIVNQKTI